MPDELARHIRTDPDCTHRWLWTINIRPWYIPRWYDRRAQGRACPICRPRQLALWAQRDAADELTRMRAEEGL